MEAQDVADVLRHDRVLESGEHGFTDPTPSGACNAQDGLELVRLEQLVRARA
jgi:hypothetical protein